MSTARQLSVALPMSFSNLNRCAIALELQVDSLNAQIASATPGSDEQKKLHCSLIEYTRIRDAFRDALYTPGLRN